MVFYIYNCVIYVEFTCLKIYVCVIYVSCIDFCRLFLIFHRLIRVCESRQWVESTYPLWVWVDSRVWQPWLCTLEYGKVFLYVQSVSFDSAIYIKDLFGSNEGEGRRGILMKRRKGKGRRGIFFNYIYVRFKKGEGRGREWF